jgi:hypothetical protein
MPAEDNIIIPRAIDIFRPTKRALVISYIGFVIPIVRIRQFVLLHIF